MRIKSDVIAILERTENSRVPAFTPEQVKAQRENQPVRERDRSLTKGLPVARPSVRPGGPLPPARKS
jgi:hypothetical protein